MNFEFNTLTLLILFGIGAVGLLFCHSRLSETAREIRETSARLQENLDRRVNEAQDRLSSETRALRDSVLSLGERMKMELIAALLHSPDVLFLDEPTIGLDVVAQHAIQQFLKYYQQKRQITILLTSHYMKDVSALCKRVVIIADGRLHYDGSLSGIVDRFSGHKVVTLHLAEGQAFEQLARFGTLLEVEPPKAKLRVARRQVPSVMAALLSAYTVEDVAVEDPPLEEVIAEVFSRVDDVALDRDARQAVLP